MDGGQMDRDLPTDPAVILERKRSDAAKAVEFDRLLRDNQLVNLQGILIRGLQEARDRLDRRCKGLEDRVAALEGAAKDNDNAKEA